MQLFYSHTSPFARKCRVVAIEVGLESKIEMIFIDWNDPNSSSKIKASNPLEKIPFLIRDDGSSLYDSPVICEYLDSIGNGKMFPKTGEARWQALRRQALADGIMDAAVLRRMEEVLRAEPMRSKEWDMRQQEKVALGIDTLEAESLPSTIDIGTISIAIALDYVDLRLKDYSWRQGHPKLEAWYKEISKRPSLQSTMPKG